MNSKTFIYDGRKIKKVGLYGLGKSNLGVFNYLRDAFPYLRFTLRQAASTEDIPEGISEVFFGNKIGEAVDEDIIFFSPSSRREKPPIPKILLAGAIPSSDAEFFFKLSKSKIFCITGSDGKSTTTALAELLLSTRQKALAIGNIGVAMTPHLKEKDTIFAAELSSFQLQYFTPGCHRAIITNISKNHLNWHSSYEEYISAKENVLKKASEPIFNYDCEESRRLICAHSPFGAISGKLSFGELSESVKAELYVTLEKGNIAINGTPTLNTAALRLIGAHNVYNLMAAMALCHGEYEPDELPTALDSFIGLSHRAELIGEYRGVKYVDSSIDSSPKRTATTLSSISEKVIVLLGGRSKGLDFSELSAALRAHAKLIILSGENKKEIFAAINNLQGMPKILVCDDLFSAIDKAIEMSTEGDTVILSPASTSYDSFKSFEERGNAFKNYVMKKHEQ